MFSQVGSRLQDIDSQLEPCIGELIQIQQVSYSDVLRMIEEFLTFETQT